MRLVGPDDDDGLNIDMGDADSQELEAVAYRVTQIVWDRCEELASRLAHAGMNHPVIFLCDVVDPFGWAMALKGSERVHEVMEQALRETPSENRPGIIFGSDLEDMEGKEPTIYGAIRDRMTGLLGYFPIVVVAKGGFSVFP